MKKLLIALFLTVIVITGCSDKKDDEGQLEDDVTVKFSSVYDEDSSHQFLDYTYNLSINVSTDEFDTMYTYEFIFDYDSKLAQAVEKYLDVENISYYDFKNNVTYSKDYEDETFTTEEGIMSSYSSMQNISKIDTEMIDSLDAQVEDFGYNIYEFKFDVDDDLLNALFTTEQLDLIREDFEITGGYVKIKLRDGAIEKTETSLNIKGIDENYYDTVKIEVIFGIDNNVSFPETIN